VAAGDGHEFSLNYAGSLHLVTVTFVCPPLFALCLPRATVNWGVKQVQNFNKDAKHVLARLRLA
jgi:hypothetical protein